MLYTAAFLGTPNGALLSHQAVLVQSLMMANLQRIDASYTYLNSGPLFHVATLMTTLATYLFAGTNVFVPRPEAHELCRVIEAEHCTGAFLMGPTIDQILAANEDGTYDLSSLRTFRGRSAWNKMITVDESPWALKPAGFGQTEVMGMLTYNAVGGEAEGSAGRPSPLAAVRIVDPEGIEVAAGETGEIVARGPQVMTGYRNRLEETGQRQLGGWHHTGDLGRREADGSLSFVGPKGRLIKSAAENIYPAEVEAALASHPAVREAAVIGVPDPTWAQSVRAIVVLQDGPGGHRAGDHRSREGEDRLLQEAEVGGVPLRTPAPQRLADRLRHPRRRIRRRRLPGQRLTGAGFRNGCGRLATTSITKTDPLWFWLWIWFLVNHIHNQNHDQPPGGWPVSSGSSPWKTISRKEKRQRPSSPRTNSS